MRTYSMGYQAIMDMPIRAFWIISGFVERIRAEEQLLEIRMEAFKAAEEHQIEQELKTLNMIAPEPVRYSAEAMIAMNSRRDNEGFAELRALAG